MAPPRSSGCHPRVAVDIVVVVDSVADEAVVVVEVLEEVAEATAATQESPTVPVVITWTGNSCLLLFSTVLHSTAVLERMTSCVSNCKVL